MKSRYPKNIDIISINIIIITSAVVTMQRFCSLPVIALGAALCLRKVSAAIELPSLAYGYCDLEPYISCEVSGCWV